MTREFGEGIMAAHEKITPICPYSSIYEKQKYEDWYDGLVFERKCLQNPRFVFFA